VRCSLRNSGTGCARPAGRRASEQRRSAAAGAPPASAVSRSPSGSAASRDRRETPHSGRRQIQCKRRSSRSSSQRTRSEPLHGATRRAAGSSQVCRRATAARSTDWSTRDASLPGSGRRAALPTLLGYHRMRQVAARPGARNEPWQRPPLPSPSEPWPAGRIGRSVVRGENATKWDVPVRTREARSRACVRGGANSERLAPRGGVVRTRVGAVRRPVAC
jgi:hypothetical protein